MPSKTELNIDMENYLREKKLLIDKSLSHLFNNNSKLNHPKELWDAVKYSLLNGGKRIRGILCIAAYESLNTNTNNFLDDCLITACSIELIHSMSLIHDDLPSMDNDDLRRGKPSCHKAFNEATAILAGDAMLSLAFQLITENTKHISDSKKLQIINTLSSAFTLGLVPGQILDLSSEKNANDLQNIETISKFKTAELIRASVLCGAIISLNTTNKTETIMQHISNFGLKTGIAFQIIDDILDITSDTKTLGKTSGKDEKQKKKTYPRIIGLEKSKAMAQNLILEAKDEIKRIPSDLSPLSLLADYIIARIN